MEKPLDSATVILLRETTDGSFRVFLMRRHRDQKFMGGAYVFPGGRLEEQDCDPALASYAADLSPEQARERLQARELSPEKAIGLFFAAVRETFEEAGVLLAYDATGQLVEFRDADFAGRFAAYRLQLYEGKISMKEIAERERIRFALDLLVPYAHWITPEIESRRFSTRFFLARHPTGQIPFHDTLEMTRSTWMAPSAALASHASGRILLMPPTLKTIEELAEFGSIDTLFSHARTRTIHTILPQAFVTDDGFGVKLPHDPEYTIDAYKQPPRPEEPSRIVMLDGRWRTFRAGDRRP